MPGKTGAASFVRGSKLPASMRPQRNAGENEMEVWKYRQTQLSFNEAPAKCRGKLRDRRIREGSYGASMRPQRNAGENSGRRLKLLRGRVRFNEAPAKCRGKRFCSWNAP